MDFQRFIEQLPNLYNNWSLPSVQPKSQRFGQVLEQVEGMTTANIMQLLNFAVDCMEPGEVYCEIGCLQGASLIGALLDRPDCMAYAIDNFSEFDESGENLEKLTNNLSKFNLEEQIFFCNQDFEEFFGELQQLELDEKIGVYFYDASYNYRSQLLALLLVKPFLANQALIVLSNANSEYVQQAILDFTATNERCQIVLNLPTIKFCDDNFWNGIFILSWGSDGINNENCLTDKCNSHFVREALRETQLKQQKESVNALFTEAGVLTHGHRYAEAEQKYKIILLYESHNASAWMNLGIIYYLTERYQEAMDALAKSLEIDSSKAAIHYSFGLVLEKISNYEQAIEAYRQAIALNPKNTDAYNNLGNILLQIGHIEEAENVYRQAIQENPNDFGGYQNLGNTLMLNNSWDEAIETYLKALTLKPRDPDILNNLGLAYEAKGEKALSLSYFGYSYYHLKKYQKAVNCFQSLLKTDKVLDLNDYLILAICLNELNQIEASISIIQEAIRCYPESALLYYQKILILNECGRFEEALSYAEEAVVLHPNDLSLYLVKQLILPAFYENYKQILFCRQQFIQGLQDITNKIKLDNPEARKNALAATSLSTSISTKFYLSYQAYNDRNLHESYGKLIHRIMTANYPSWIAPLQMPPLKSNGKIRIGYLSESMSNASASKWILGWLKHCDREKFEIYCYYTGSLLEGDVITQNIKLLSDVFHHIPEDLELACHQIFKDQLHILVFLAIGMWAPTTHLASLRLAPVQCTTWGHPITSGLPTIDYFLSSDLFEPKNAQEHYTEELIRLPNLGISYPEPFIPKPTKTRSDFQLREDAVIYLSCQAISKYLPQHDYLIVEIARLVPKAQFVFVFRTEFLNSSDTTIETKFRQRLYEAFTRANLNLDDYCIFLPRQKWDSYTSLMLTSDVFLDTLSFSGGHTTFDAVACNLPIVTCPGELMRGCQSYGILKMLGVTDTIAQNEAEYIEIAVKLGLDPQWREGISQRMSQRHAYLYEDKSCVKGLEQFYQQVVQERLAEQETTLLTLPKTFQASSTKKIVLHVGCGSYNPEILPERFRSEEWQELRLDIDPTVRPDLIGSITDMSAVPSQSVDAVYSSHNVEHVYYHQVPLALTEFHRVLKLGGFAMILVPDIQTAAEAVARGNLEDHPLYISPAGPIAAIDMFYGFREMIAPGNYYMAHHTAFTAKSLGDKMQQIGFRELEVRRENFNIVAIGYK